MGFETVVLEKVAEVLKQDNVAEFFCGSLSVICTEAEARRRSARGHLQDRQVGLREAVGRGRRGAHEVHVLDHIALAGWRRQLDEVVLEVQFDRCEPALHVGGAVRVLDITHGRGVLGKGRQRQQAGGQGRLAGEADGGRHGEVSSK